MRPLLKQRFLFVIFVLLLVLVTIWLATTEPQGVVRDYLLRYGYIGFFAAAFVGGLNLFVPISHLVVVAPFLNVGLNPWLLIVIGSFGATMADAVGYGIGRSGGSYQLKSIDRFKVWLEIKISKRPKLAPLVLFGWAALVPVPYKKT